MVDFTHLHVHTEYSLLDGSARIKKLVKRAKELEMKALAITDHGVMYGVVDFYKACKAEGIKPVIGCEIYVTPRSLYKKDGNMDAQNFHLVLLAKNNDGYKNLMKIVSTAFIDGFYYKPRADFELLRKHSEGLIALSACLGGEVQNYLLNGDYEGARKKAFEYKEIFGEDNYYLELQDHGIEEQKRVNRELVKLSKETGIPLVATNDLHYINREDAMAHEILLCIQTAKTIEDEDRMKFTGSEFYLKSAEEMHELFAFAPEVFDNIQKIVEQCNVEFDFNTYKLPTFTPPDGMNSKEYLRKLCFEGLEKRYSKYNESVSDNSEDGHSDSNSSTKGSNKKDAIERLNYELSVIEEMGYVDYFLIVWDFIRFANDNEIVTGPGRGSAVGSIVSYTLGITKVEPLKYNLVFERLLNPERVSMPDIDSDFCYERRQEVIDYVVEKYGKDKVAQIVTFGTMAARGVIRDVGRALSYSYAEVDAIAKKIPFELNMTIERALEVSTELRNEYESDERVERLINISKSLEGLPRHSSTHAAGVVISSEPIVENVPVSKNEDTIVTQFPMTTLEELGLLKMDFLGLRTLTVLRDALIFIDKNRGIKLDLDTIDFEDKEVYEMIARGETEGIFQLESGGMTNFMKELKPSTLEDIIAGISLYRPGPMEQIPNYIRNKNKPDQIQYIDEALRPILDVTYGCMVYQEQVMQIVKDLAGYSMGRADLVRKAMSKKKHDVMEEERKNFIHGLLDSEGNTIVPGAVKNGVSVENANKIFDQMTDFASYAFNKSHAAAYAVIGYQTAYLKKHYPVEFMTALLTSVMGNNGKIAFYIHACRKMGIEVLPPDINESYVSFSVTGNKIRFGMAAVKNVGRGAIEAIIAARTEKGAFRGFTEFCEKVNLSEVNKRAVESMIKAGAFDSLKLGRSQLLSVYEKVMESVVNSRRRNIEGQVSMFSSMGMLSGEAANSSNALPLGRDLTSAASSALASASASAQTFTTSVASDSGLLPTSVSAETTALAAFTDSGLDNFEKVKEFGKKYLLSMEKEMIGLYISGHPLDEFDTELEKQTNTRISEIISINTEDTDSIEIKVRDGERVIVGGIIASINIKSTRNNDIMEFISLEDVAGSIEVIVFPKTYQKYSSVLLEDNVVIVKGRISIKEDEQPKIIAEEIKELKKMEVKELNKLYIRISQEQINEVKNVLMKYRGNNPVHLVIKETAKNLLSPKELWVNITEVLLKELQEKYGNENVKVV